MLGAIWGDVAGSPYEFDACNYKGKDFPLLSGESRFTDDSVMTLGVAQGLMACRPGDSDEQICRKLTEAMQTLGRHYPHCGYGRRFRDWIFADRPQPYGSYGNGSAMRVSPAGWVCDSLEDTLRLAELTARISHNHPEGIQGARAIAGAVFLARTGAGKADIRRFAEGLGYDLSRSCDQIRPQYRMCESCQGSVPQALTAFLESTGFEDALRTAISLGGDSDTIGAMAGAVAEAYYGLPAGWDEKILGYLTPELQEVARRFLPLRKARKER